VAFRPTTDADCLFARLCDLAEGRERDDITSALVDRYSSLAKRIARGFRGRGEPLEDLEQVAAIGLVSAIKRFDPGRGAKFVTYATQTISGEIKRHFRDRGWTVRVPRRLQELNQAVRKAKDSLGQTLGRPPSIAEVASAVGVSEEAAVEAMELGQHAYDVLSLDDDAHEDGNSGHRKEAHDLPTHGGLDLTALDVRTALARLEPRLRNILVWKFVGGYSQADIARKLEISQMHVSRLQAKAVEQVRTLMLRGEGDGSDA